MAMLNATQVSQLTTKAGTTVTKFLENTPMRAGYGRVLKEIKDARNSQLAHLGSDKVVFRNAGEHGKHIMAFGGGTCRFLGVTNPASKMEKSVIAQFKEYVNAAKTLLSRGVILK
mgnify:CR=1 FL=1